VAKADNEAVTILINSGSSYQPQGFPTIPRYKELTSRDPWHQNVFNMYIDLIK
jgi:hypothetical protein